LLIKLPVHPSTVEELALIRFWLLKLSQTHFKEIYANHSILNPEFLSVLNPRAGPRKILFHANQVVLLVEAAITANIAQIICVRRILLWTPLQAAHRYNCCCRTASACEPQHINGAGFVGPFVVLVLLAGFVGHLLVLLGLLLLMQFIVFTKAGGSSEEYSSTSNRSSHFRSHGEGDASSAVADT
jgi:hypothetical protein